VNQEIWKTIDGFENKYQVSNLGRVRSVNRIIKDAIGRKRCLKGKLLAFAYNKGYPFVTLWSGSEQKRISKFVSRLVAQAFIPNPYNLPFVNHIDENPKNNHVSNLEWCTVAYNIAYNGAMKRTSQKNKKPLKLINLETDEERIFDSIGAACRFLNTTQAREFSKAAKHGFSVFKSRNCFWKCVMLEKTAS